MDTSFLAEILGFAALGVGIFAYQIKAPRMVLWIMCIPCLLWTLHFLALAQFSGVIISFAALARNACAATLPRKYMVITTALCLLLAIIASIPTLHEVKDFLPFLAGLGMALAVYLRHRPSAFRICTLFGELSWLAYGVAISSVSLVAANILISVSLLASIARYDLGWPIPDVRKLTLTKLSSRPVLTDSFSLISLLLVTFWWI